MLFYPSFYTASSAVNKLLSKDYKSIMCTVLMLHINPALFNFSSSPTETGQWKPDANSWESQDAALQ